MTARTSATRRWMVAVSVAASLIVAVGLMQSSPAGASASGPTTEALARPAEETDHSNEPSVAITREYIVTPRLLSQPANRAAWEQLLRDLPTQASESVDPIGTSGSFLIKAGDRAHRQLQEATAVVSVEPNFVFAASTQLESASTVTPTSSADNSRDLIGLPAVASQGARGAGTAVAVLDTGVSFQGTQLSGKRIHPACFSTTNVAQSVESVCPGGASESTATTAAEPCGAPSACNHGTSVAAIAAGKATTVTTVSLAGNTVSGIAPAADVIPIQVFSRFHSSAACGSLPTPCYQAVFDDILRALDYVKNLRVQGTNVVAANLSVGGTQTAQCSSIPWRNAFQALNQAGVAVPVSTGNLGRSSAIMIPACVTGAIPVSATNRSDQVASFADTASGYPILYAPGSDVVTQTFGSAGPSSPIWAAVSGTSFSAPMVTGAIAALKSAFPSATSPMIATRLRQTGSAVSIRQGGTRLGFSHPRIDLSAAYTRLAGADPHVNAVRPQLRAVRVDVSPSRADSVTVRCSSSKRTRTVRAAATRVVVGKFPHRTRVECRSRGHFGTTAGVWSQPQSGYTARPTVRPKKPKVLKRNRKGPTRSRLVFGAPKVATRGAPIQRYIVRCRAPGTAVSRARSNKRRVVLNVPFAQQTRQVGCQVRTKTAAGKSKWSPTRNVRSR